MDVKAILIVGMPQPGVESAGGMPEFVAGSPIAALDILGCPLAVRVAQQLMAGGVSSVAIVTNSEVACPTSLKQEAARENIRFVSASAAELWRECEGVFQEFTDAELVIVWRLGAYLELDLADLIHNHRVRRARVTQVFGPGSEKFDIFAINGSRRNDAAYLFRHGLQESRTASSPYAFHGYRNALRNARDLRQLTIEGLQLRNRIEPVGEQVRPGIWLGARARVQHGARLLAPCYVGAYSRVRASAVITRCSAVEQHCEIDFGSVVENSSVLPFSYVGAGLDVCHSVVCNRRLLPLRRDVEIEITDSRLIGVFSEHAGVRAIASMGALLGLVPSQIIRGMFAKSQRGQPSTLPEAVQEPAAALRETAPLQPSTESTEFPGTVAVARRYGNE
jgi:carbonic anhydrase/acetyltransferase-like protein (isoleucine patch superfamily)